MCVCIFSYLHTMESCAVFISSSMLAIHENEENVARQKNAELLLKIVKKTEVTRGTHSRVLKLPINCLVLADCSHKCMLHQWEEKGGGEFYTTVSYFCVVRLRRLISASRTRIDRGEFSCGFVCATAYAARVSASPEVSLRCVFPAICWDRTMVLRDAKHLVFLSRFCLAFLPSLHVRLD